MTKTPNEYSLFPEDERIIEWEENAERAIQGAYDDGQISEESYRRLVIDKYEGTDVQEAADHYTLVNISLVESIKSMLHERIQTGAGYIESITPDHPLYNKALERYDTLIEDWRKIP